MAASEAYEIEMHASAMVRDAENLLALTRSLKEAWLFGQLGSGFEGGATKTDEDAQAVGELLGKIGEKKIVDGQAQA